MTPVQQTYDRFHWALCVVFAVVPLLLFLSVLWVFSGSDPRVETVLSAVKPVPKALFAYAGTQVGVVVLNYGTYVFATPFFAWVLSRISWPSCATGRTLPGSACAFSSGSPPFMRRSSVWLSSC